MRFLTRDGVPPELKLEVKLGSEAERPAVAGDRWRNWVFSLQGSASFNGEESSRTRELGREHQCRSHHAGMEDHARCRDRSRARGVRPRRGRASQAPTGASATSTGSSSSRLGEHWSFGARGEIESSTFDNMEVAIAAAPAVEFNFFPYSQYTRRQLRAQYAVGVSQLPLLRGDAVRRARGDAAESRAVADARTARAVGLDRSKRRVVAIPARFVEVPAGGDRARSRLRLAQRACRWRRR